MKKELSKVTNFDQVDYSIIDDEYNEYNIIQNFSDTSVNKTISSIVLSYKNLYCLDNTSINKEKHITKIKEVINNLTFELFEILSNEYNNFIDELNEYNSLNFLNKIKMHKTLINILDCSIDDIENIKYISNIYTKTREQKDNYEIKDLRSTTEEKLVEPHLLKSIILKIRKDNIYLKNKINKLKQS